MLVSIVCVQLFDKHILSPGNSGEHNKLVISVILVANSNPAQDIYVCF